MAIPVLPLVVLGVGMLVLRGRRRSSSKKGSEGTEPLPEPKTVIFIPPPPDEAPSEPSGPPGQSCYPPEGDGAWDEFGHCKAFWIDGATDEAIAKLAREEWEARGRPTFSELCRMVPDPAGGEFAPPKDNPRLNEIVVACLQRYYDVGSIFPPTEGLQGHEPSSPYWVHRAWANAMVVVKKELCGL
ncbi:MAG: hypothetical protein AB1Z98_20930 [Nannocystaceae bacterium]